jgi:hypothetical protein
MAARLGVATCPGLCFQVFDDPVVGQGAQEAASREPQCGSLKDPAQVLGGELAEVDAPIRVIPVAKVDSPILGGKKGTGEDSFPGKSKPLPDGFGLGKILAAQDASGIPNPLGEVGRVLAVLGRSLGYPGNCFQKLGDRQ